MSEYRQYERHDAPIDPTRCKASVHSNDRAAHIYQCRRKTTKDGWCRQHHPDAVAARDKASTKAYQVRLERSPPVQLGRAIKELDRLRKSLARKEAALREADSLRKYADNYADYHIEKFYGDDPGHVGGVNKLRQMCNAYRAAREKDVDPGAES